jgi:Skp family chaperone for outer membrane proteins
VTPQRVESSLLVVQEFTDSAGSEWRPGDRASLARAAVRRAATERPALFRVEYATEELDPEAEWFTAIVEEAEARYAQVKHRREGEAESREKALREEMREQQRGQPDLERRFREQEAAKEERLMQARDEQERRQIEAELELGFMGFH